MKSKWFEFKDSAIRLREKGYSIRDIEKQFGIPRSTLSGWFKEVELSGQQKKDLHNRWLGGLTEARKKAVLWHNEQKAVRLEQARNRAVEFLQDDFFQDKTSLHLAMAMLYLGEGFKKNNDTGLGNTDVDILKFFVKVLIQEFQVSIEKIKCELHLREDQNKNVIRDYWSKSLGIPIGNFTSVSYDLRTKGRPTYSDYKGVCVVRCGSVHIQRYLVNLSRLFIQKYTLTS